MAHSELTLQYVLNKCWDTFAPIKYYWNDKLIWDDNLDADAWLSPAEAFKLFAHDNPRYENYIVENFKLEVVEYHHTVLYMYGKESGKDV